MEGVRFSLTDEESRMAVTRVIRRRQRTRSSGRLPSTVSSSPLSIVFNVAFFASGMRAMDSVRRIRQGSGNASSFAVENEHVISGDCATMHRSGTKRERRLSRRIHGIL